MLCGRAESVPSEGPKGEAIISATTAAQARWIVVHFLTDRFWLLSGNRYARVLRANEDIDCAKIIGLNAE